MIKKSKKWFAGLLCIIMMITLIPGNFVFGEETAPENDYLGVARKSQYVLYASSKENGIQLNGKKYVINGNVHANSDIAAYLDKLDVRGKLETTGKVVNYNNAVTQYIKKENAPERVLIDPSKYIVDSLGANAKVYENWTSLSDSTIENTEPIQAKSGLQFSASVIKLKNTIMSNGSMLVNASETFVSQENEEVLLYSANGDIQVSAQDIEINGIIYAPNGTVQIGGTNVKINGMIIAKKIQIGANNKLIINQNLNLKNGPAFKYYNDELQIYSEAEYDDTTEAINVNWESTFDEGKFEVYSSTDNKNFTLLGTVTGANTYAYKTNGSTNDMYFKVKQILNNGFTKESNTVKMVYDVYKCQYVFEDTDTDNEKLTDTYEFFLETDKNNVDTDGDDLPDYFEVFLTGTDPLYKDSDEDGVLDCDEDTDGDTLSNKYEMKLDTHPQKVDTDDDTLADNYEVEGIKIKGDDTNTYKTLPTNADTDEDGLSDSDEALLGLNPLSKDSDGDGTFDYDEKFQQTKTEEITEKDKDEVTGVTIDINATGNIDTTTEIKSVYNIDKISSSVVGLMGPPIDINTTSKFETATISFKMNKTKLSDDDLEYMSVMWYDKDNNTFELLDTNRDIEKGIISTTTKHFSTYMVVDAREWFAAWNKDLNQSTPGQTSVKLHTVMAVDCSGSMDWNDPVSQGNSINNCFRSKAVTNFINTMDSDDKAAIYTFDYDVNLVCDITNDKTRLINAASDFYSNGGTNISGVITEATNKLLSDNEATKKMIILLSDGYPDPDVKVSDEILQKAKNGQIKIHTICLGDDCDEVEMQRIANTTGGTCFKATSQELPEIYEEISMGADFSKKDTDGDKLPDEVETKGIRTQTAQTINTNPLSKHSDMDGLEDGIEIDPTLVKFTYHGYYKDQLYTSVSYGYKMISNPTKNDTDGDGFNDNIDNFPMVPDKKLGSEKYFTELNKLVANFSGNKKAEESLRIMMKDINAFGNTSIISDKEWISLCNRFNKEVKNYSYNKNKFLWFDTYSLTDKKLGKTLHYFRNKLNRAPVSFYNMVELVDKGKWKLYKYTKTRYHMHGENGEYNLKFISSEDGKYEAVFDKNGKLLTQDGDVYYNQINMGTYNYCSEIINKSLHTKFDVDTYKKWGNTPDATDSNYLKHAEVPKNITNDVKEYKYNLFGLNEDECFG